MSGGNPARSMVEFDRDKRERLRQVLRAGGQGTERILHVRYELLVRKYLLEYLEENDTVTLLIPDRDRENREDFIWCVPIERQKWNKWYALSEKFKTVTPKEHGGVRYMNRMEGRNVKTILIMPNAQQSDDDAVTACAYLRMIKGMTCRMYVVRCTDDPLTGARLIERAVGADITLVEDMELEGEEDAAP